VLIDSCGFHFSVAALMAVKAALRDPGHVLGDWLPATSGGDNPCNWSVVYCHRGQLYKLYASSPAAFCSRIYPDAAPPWPIEID
jgi:hypothetical protein